MNRIKKAIFLTHPKSLNLDAKVSGGVQLCSREFYSLLQLSGFALTQVNVEYTRNIFQRLLIRIKFGLYSMFDTKKDINRIIEVIEKNNISHVFINMASLLRYAKPIKLHFGTKIEIILLSHGNDSGDFLHLTTKPILSYNIFTKCRDIMRLGFLVYIESLYRNKYLDGVLSVSETEKEIENWFGAKKSIFIPRTINKQLNFPLNTDYSKVGFIGRLDHPPNYQGITMVLNELINYETKDIKFKLIGAPQSWGEKIAKNYPFVDYLGELNDSEVNEEIATWAIILNTVFWYSTGVTTKFAKCLEWGVPTITTIQGTRGYQWNEGTLEYVDSPKQMAKKISLMINNKIEIEKLKKELQTIKNSSISLEELAEMLKEKI